MDSILDFAIDNYIVLIVITIFLAFSFVGYFVSAKKKKTKPFKIKNNNEEINLDNLEVNNNVSLQDMVKEYASVKQNDTKNQNDNPPML